MWAVAVVDLGLLESTFLKLTPRLLLALKKRQNETQKATKQQADYRAAMIMYYSQLIPKYTKDEELSLESILEYFGIKIDDNEFEDVENMVAAIKALNTQLGGMEVEA